MNRNREEPDDLFEEEILKCETVAGVRHCLHLYVCENSHDSLLTLPLLCVSLRIGKTKSYQQLVGNLKVSVPYPKAGCCLVE